MNRSKLGRPASITAALMYLIGFFGGYVPALLAAGFILLCEDENFIRRAAVKTLTILVLVSLASVLTNLIPNMVGIFQSMLAIFRVHFGTSLLDNFTATLSQTLTLIKTALLILMAILALFGKSIDLQPLSNWADK